MESADIILIIALVFSVVLHEMAHGYAANWLGDPTARLAGRLSANPVVHIDPLMSVILPAFLILSGSPILFGAAKPVPYNPYNLSNQKWGEAIVAVAGPVMNLAIAFIFAMLINFHMMLGLSAMFVQVAFSIVMLNIFLALFNLIPIPPLDGSKILPRLLPYNLSMKYENLRVNMERNLAVSFFVVILVFVFFLGGPLYETTRWLADLIIFI
ncbi:site-2 protease family protein [Candidatus Kaiserbacteria bacterium]|nr:site-2 protease family protein [Candidatus Kaiserbacteria bacterium]